MQNSSGTSNRRRRPDPHRRTDLSTAGFQGSDREAGSRRSRPDPEDVGGIAELKWIAEYADIHRILVAPHGIFDGLIGLAAHVHMAAALPQNYIAFEYPFGQPEWWYDIVEGLPNPIVKKGFIDVWDRPGLGVTFKVAAAKPHLAEEDRQFFD
jgi:L-alanine-DL-glutamate epimerase-like enolase superfamily enzyme